MVAYFNTICRSWLDNKKASIKCITVGWHTAQYLSIDRDTVINIEADRDILDSGYRNLEIRDILDSGYRNLEIRDILDSGYRILEIRDILDSENRILEIRDMLYNGYRILEIRDILDTDSGFRNLENEVNHYEEKLGKFRNDLNLCLQFAKIS